MVKMEFVGMWADEREGESGDETELGYLMVEMGFEGSLDGCDAIGGKVRIDGEKMEGEGDGFIGRDGEARSVGEVCVQEVDVLRGGLNRRGGRVIVLAKSEMRD